MMGGGGHVRPAAQRRDSRTPSASQRKLQQSIDRVLSDDEGRTMLVTALLADRTFMDNLLQRMAAIPEWKSLAARRLAPETAGGSLVSPPPAAADLYACSMHPEVTSSTPGPCPKCGMALVRTAQEHAH
jgi:hypothetical protein